MNYDVQTVQQQKLYEEIYAVCHLKSFKSLKLTTKYQENQSFPVCVVVYSNCVKILWKLLVLREFCPKFFSIDEILCRTEASLT